MLTCARCTVIYNTFGVIVRRYVHIANYARDRCNRRACIPTVSRYVYTCSLQIHFMKFHFMVSCRSRGLRFGAKNWSNRCDAPAFTPLPSEAQVVRTLSRQIILRNLLFTLFLPLYSRVYLLYSSIYDISYIVILYMTVLTCIKFQKYLQFIYIIIFFGDLKSTQRFDKYIVKHQ